MSAHLIGRHAACECQNSLQELTWLVFLNMALGDARMRRAAGSKAEQIRVVRDDYA